MPTLEKIHSTELEFEELLRSCLKFDCCRSFSVVILVMIMDSAILFMEDIVLDWQSLHEGPRFPVQVSTRISFPTVIFVRSLEESVLPGQIEDLPDSQSSIIFPDVPSRR
jgi:hypothetical protein